MRNTFPARIIATALCLAVGLLIVVLPGCSKEKPLIPQNLDELSLVDMWKAVVKTIGIQESTSYLESMNLRVLNGKRKELDFDCYVTTESEWTMYTISFSEKGELNWSSGQIKNSQNMPLTFNPEMLFTQLDTFGLTNIRPTVSGFTIDISMQTGADYVFDKPFLLYHLKDGTLAPLEHVKLSSGRPSLPILVGSITIDKPPKGHFETYELPEYWFLSEDIDKADTVEYWEK